MNVDNYLTEITEITDHRGKLIIAEEVNHIPFDIKRVYCVLDVNDGKPRGFHAHKELRQLAICIKGSCDFVLDDGLERTTIKMKDAKQGLLIEPMIWHEMHNFSNDCVILVIANDIYHESDYIRNYNDFSKATRS